MLGFVHLWITYFLMSYVDCNIGIESKDLIFGMQGILGSVGSMFSTPPDKQVSHHLLSLMNLQQLEVVVGVCDGSPQGLDSDPASATSDRFRSFAPLSS